MNFEHLLFAIDLCNNGLLHFNLGIHYSFLYNKRWYPLRATILRAMEEANENVNNFNVREALWELSKLGIYVRLGQIEFLNEEPVDLNYDEIISEIILLRNSLNGLID